MFKDIENLKIISIHKGVSKKRSAVTCRANYALIMRISGEVTYGFENRDIKVKAGEVIFIPKGASYSFSSLPDQPCEYVSIQFSADIEQASAFVYPLKDFQELDEFKTNIAQTWKLGGQAEQYKCYSLFYSFLAYLKNLEQLSYVNKEKLDIISPAVTYLNKHIYDCNLKIEKLSGICGISGTYFNKIFRKKYGTSPQKYILSKRLSHAKAIIDSGDFDTIAEVAQTVGYNDPLYFSRAFKKKYGTCPTSIIKD